MSRIWLVTGSLEPGGDRKSKGQPERTSPCGAGSG